MAANEFKDVLKKMVEYLGATKSKPSHLQRIIALNHDSIFKRTNIYSLLNVLNQENASYSTIIQCQERIMSLTLLGYLNLDNTEKSMKMLHPWQ